MVIFIHCKTVLTNWNRSTTSQIQSLDPYIGIQKKKKPFGYNLAAEKICLLINLVLLNLFSVERSYFHSAPKTVTDQKVNTRVFSIQSMGFLMNFQICAICSILLFWVYWVGYQVPDCNLIVPKGDKLQNYKFWVILVVFTFLTWPNIIQR